MIPAEQPHQNVLVADDDFDDFFAFEIACQDLSFKILLSHVTTSTALMKVLERELPDILFLDIMLPTRAGNMCLRDLRMNRRYDSLPIIMYTSMTDLENIEFCFNEGANLYAIKPNSFADLRDMLERILTINWKTTMYFPTKANFVIKPKGI